MGIRWLRETVQRGRDYDRAFEERLRAGEDVHGEASFVESLRPATVLDAGCGTGRVAVELARRGVRTTGVDLDDAMLARAREKASDLEWISADLSTLDLRDASGARRTFDVAVMAGNVMIFVEPGTEPAVVAALAAHLVPGGALVAGFEIAPGHLSLAEYDQAAEEAGLRLEERWATWDRLPWRAGGRYAVSLHRSPHPAG